MTAAKLSIWLLAYGASSIAAGAAFIAFAWRLDGLAQGIGSGFGAYMLLAGIALMLHARRSPELFLATGLFLLGWSIFDLVANGLGRQQLFGVLGAVITVHGYWVLKQEIAKR